MTSLQAKSFWSLLPLKFVRIVDIEGTRLTQKLRSYIQPKFIAAVCHLIQAEDTHFFDTRKPCAVRRHSDANICPFRFMRSLTVRSSVLNQATGSAAPIMQKSDSCCFGISSFTFIGIAVRCIHT
jgi:hypothetical protein